VALAEPQNASRQAWVPLAGLTRDIRNWLKDSGDRSIAQKIAGGAFLIRVFSAGLIYLLQILLARWMGSFEFGIYVYVWTLVSVIGDLPRRPSSIGQRSSSFCNPGLLIIRFLSRSFVTPRTPSLSRLHRRRHPVGRARSDRSVRRRLSPLPQTGVDAGAVAEEL
jgi:hypothetical protein